MVLEEVIIVNPRGGGKKRASTRKNPTRKRRTKSVASRKNPPKAGMVWRKGYARANGTRVKGTWVNNPGRRRRARSNPRKRTTTTRSNPRRRKRRTTTKRRRRNTVYRGRRNPARSRTRTVVKYRYRNNPAPRRRRRARRNPATTGGGAYQGKWSIKKAMKQVAMNEFLFGGAGLIAASLGPTYLQSTTARDFTSGHRDWLWSGVIALGGGMFIGRSFGAREGRAWAIAVAAVTAVKALRAFTGGQFSLPLVGAQHGAGQQQLGLDTALANASYYGGNLGAVEEVYPGQINKFYTPALDSPFVVQTT